MDNSDPVAISGIAGKFPQCHNVEQFKESLLRGDDLIDHNNSSRHPAGYYGTPTGYGSIPIIDKFDASFFGIHHKQANFMDPRQRLLLECTYEAIIDAGYNPTDLRGSNTGVYVGISAFNNYEVYRNREDTDGYTNIGVSNALASNRISYCFDFKGPSLSIDTACSSSLYAFAVAINDLNAGVVDSAVVCGAHLFFHPFDSIEFTRLGMLSKESKCMVYSKDRSGYVRSEAMVAYFLQRKSKARRVYSTVLGAACNNDGYKKQGVTFPSSELQYELMDTLYKRVNVDPRDVTFVEAHGTGTKVGDVQECLAISRHFAAGRTKPLLIGGVKSNMGHAEISSGLCSMTKAIISMESGIIPRNLHLENPDTTIPGICDNKLKVVSENTKLEPGLIGVNSFGFGGANAHVILKPHDKMKIHYEKPKNRLVQVSGRTEEAVLHFLNEIEAHQDDQEYLALIDEVHRKNIEGHNYRGYTVLGGKPVKEICRTALNRPIWFIYTGMGSQWNKMGKDLLNIPVFRKTIERCAVALKPYNVDLLKILTDDNPATFDDITNCFCAISSVEIALTDVLRELGIVPDGIAGHSLGEVGCAYADGTLTVEQAALLGYSRGYASTNTKIIRGQMAALGLSKEEAQKLLPDGIYIACQNSKTSVTISGPEAETKAFVEELSSRGIFARLVNSANIAYHTKYVADAGRLLLEFCKGVLTDPKPRSGKWVSSSVKPSDVDAEWARLNCAEYHWNNFCNTVLFDQVYAHIPDNAIVVEVAPHGLLQAILKRELNSQHTHISVTNRLSEDNEQFFLSGVGKIFLAGGQPCLRQLYPDVTFPVSRGTNHLSQAIQWDHSVSWFTPRFDFENCIGKTVNVNIADKKYSYLCGHDIDGRILMAATGYLELVWRVALDLTLVKNIENFPVVFENVRFLRASVLQYGENVSFLVNIMRSSGYFEIFESGSVVCSGKILTVKDISAEFSGAEDVSEPTKNGSPVLKTEDVYKEFRLRKYHYKDMFRGIVEVDLSGSKAILEWKGNFTAFMDTMLQASIMGNTSRKLYLPSFLLKVVIDPAKHISLANEKKEIPLYYNQDLGIFKSGGIEFVCMDTILAPRKQNTQAPPLLETYDLIYYETSVKNQYDFQAAIRIALQIVIQNYPGMTKELNICEVTADDINENLNKTIKSILDLQPFMEVTYASKAANEIKTKFDVIVINDKIISNVNVATLAQRLTDTGFLLYKGKYEKISSNSLQIIFQSVADEESLYLLRPQCDVPKNYDILHISNTNFAWVEKLKVLAKRVDSHTVYLVSQDEDISGIVGFMKCLLVEPTKQQFRAVFIDQKTEEFSPNSELYRDQLKKNLTFNVLKDNNWGTYVHLPLRDIEDRKVGNAAVNISVIGDLSTITWIERPFEGLRYDQATDLAYVYYGALNFKDVIVASGKLNIEDPPHPMNTDVSIGFEYSGVTTKGKRIMGMVANEAMALQTHVDEYFTWELPKNWSLKEAATVPCVYATCYYGLIIRAQMKRGASILIHAGTGGIGIAAITIALSMGCKVFTTVGSKEKREYLKKMFPQIEDKNIGCSRDATFETMIKTNTKGRGVDVVLNSLADELFQASMRCVAEGGSFVEIGKADLMNSSPIRSKMFLKNISFHGVHLERFFFYNNEQKRKVHALITEALARNEIKPLPHMVYGENEAESAFRLLASGKHKGKVLIEVRNEDLVPITAPIRSICAKPSLYFDCKKSYVLVGGLGGFGLELADWMIQRGATKIVLNSRRGITAGYQSYCLKKWTQFKEITVKINTSDTTTTKGAEELIDFANQLGPVGGIFNMALVLKDALIVNQTKETYEDVFKPKIVSGQNLDAISRRACPELDHFVVFSSIACGRGNVGQTNYGMANSALERLCEKRKQQQLPGLAVQWGAIGDVGALAKLGIEDKVFKNMQPQSIASCLSVLEMFMLQERPIGSSLVLQETDETTQKQNTRTPAEAVAHILGINNLDLVDKSMTLSQLGLDSLMGTEIKQTLYRNFQIDLSQEEIRNLTLDALVLMKNTEAAPEPVKPAVEQKAKAPVEDNVQYILPDEVVVKMNNVRNSRNVFVFHPIEGNLDLLMPMGKKLNATVYGFNAIKGSDFDSMGDLTRYYLDRIREIQPTGPYQIVGYSYGGVVSLEVGLQMEKSGEKVDLTFIDSSPLFVSTVTQHTYIKIGKSESKTQDRILEVFAESLPESNQEKVSQILATAMDMNAKLEKISEYLAKETGIDYTKIYESAFSFYKRLMHCIHYSQSEMFNGKVLLIRRDHNPFITGEDYCLQENCKEKIQIIKLKGDHVTILQDENIQRVADAINRFNGL
ncbi:unnamed protein product [Phyllotreta striolata]|uniref:Fatty acid synthase n=1 Tax=Phyllotreta striolata TaxID=444603 RepID=A0A9N9TAU4_PHYSR|nr:unnamed protein product [Phyllotreta striolata]